MCTKLTCILHTFFSVIYSIEIQAHLVPFRLTACNLVLTLFGIEPPISVWKIQIINQRPTKNQQAAVYLYCNRCLHQIQDSSLDSRSISQYSCAVRTLGCSVGAWYSNPGLRTSGHPNPAGTRPDRNTQPLYPAPLSTRDCSRPSSPNTHLRWRKKAGEGGYCQKEWPKLSLPNTEAAGMLLQDICSS